MSGSDAAPVLVWFRRDLRLADNPALAEAAETGAPVIPVYVLDERLEGRPIGGAARWWLNKSLRALAASLEMVGSRLVLRRGDAGEQIGRLVAETGASAVFWNRLYEPEAAARDRAVAERLRASGVRAEAFKGSLLAEPGAVLNGSGGPYRVYTPFARALRAHVGWPKLRRAPERLIVPSSWPASEDLDAWGLHPARPDWSAGFDWTPGEEAANARLHGFLDEALDAYPTARDRPDVDGTTRLSPHLHWGEIGPAQVLCAARGAAEQGRAGERAADKLIGEIAWREFNAHTLHHLPHMPDRPLRPPFERFPFRDDPDGLEGWRRGRTGYPIVDAGLRQLWATGWMHNRVRMIVASFLVKDLLIDWRQGEAWFWDTLVDADAANNAANWQWIAGSGQDAAPFFRIFNPVTQGEKFDPEGAYVRRWIPELKSLPDAYVHKPWTAPAPVLARAGVRIGDYPAPVVDHGQARTRALEAFATLKDQDSTKRA